MLRRTLSLSLLMTSSLAFANPFANVPPPPRVERDNDVVDYYFGQAVADPFRWLEDVNAPRTRAFIEAQNVRTRALLDSPVQRELRSRLEHLVNFERMSAPVRTDRYFVFRKNTGLQKHSVTFIAEKLDDEPKVLFDPNTFSEDGTTALSTTAFTRDGAYVAYGKSVGGSDDQTIRIRNILSGSDLPEIFQNMRFAGIDWLNDNSGFYFSRYPKPGTVPEDQERLNHKLFFHKLGGDPEKAEVIYARPDNPQISVYPSVSFDGHWLMIYESLGTDDEVGVLIAPASEPKKLTRVVEVGVASVWIIHNVGDTFYAVTDKDAPRRKLVKFTLDRPQPEHWQTVIEQTDAVIESVLPVGDKFVVTTKRDVASVINVHNLDGTPDRQIELPTVGSASASARPDDTEVFITFTSYTYPTSIFRYDLKTHETKPFFSPKVDFDPAAYETRQVFYHSKDGTRVPMFVTHKKGIKLDRNNPTLLYGYGGFNVGMSPGFSSFDVAWLERGGVYAVACVRGGDEYGSAWHDAGKLDKKQNVFDDFHAAAEFLIREGYTQPKRLAINGGSNGGLLVAACMLQRPELYGAVVAEVGVFDMLRYHRWGTGRFWTVEYGNAEASEAQFRTLLAYSPLHNVAPQVSYPPVLVTTGDGDDRVVPCHSLKFVAQMNAQSMSNPVFLRYDVGSGHGGGKPLTKAMDEQADVFAFLFKTVGQK